jgi:hypothetical protein
VQNIVHKGKQLVRLIHKNLQHMTPAIFLPIEPEVSQDKSRKNLRKIRDVISNQVHFRPCILPIAGEFCLAFLRVNEGTILILQRNLLDAI